MTRIIKESSTTPSADVWEASVADPSALTDEAAASFLSAAEARVTDNYTIRAIVEGDPADFSEGATITLDARGSSHDGEWLIIGKRSAHTGYTELELGALRTHFLDDTSRLGNRLSKKERFT